MINQEYYYEMNELANQCKRDWSIDENSPVDLFSIAYNKINNLTIVFMDMDKEVSGASSKFDDEKIIFINNNNSYGRQRFTLAHELYHLKYDKKFITCLKNSDKNDEKKADQFASCLLMSHGALLNYEKEHNIKEWSINEIIDAEQFFQMSHHAFLWRLRTLEKITYDNYESYKYNSKNIALKRGYDIKLYKQLYQEQTTIGNYIKLVETAYDKNKISIGKKEELLLDAFRMDEVF